MFLIQKYSVNTYDDIIFNQSIYNNYQTINNIQNLLVFGPSSSGKKTFIKLLLKNLYGPSVFNIKDIEYTITNYGSNCVKVKLQQSNFHLIFKPFNSALDKYIIQEIIVEFCKKNNMCFFDSKLSYKVIVIYNAELLSSQAQYSLRSLMEQFTDTCRFILIVKNVNTIIDSIVSRSLKIILRAPNDNDMSILFDRINNGENLDIKEDLKQEIIQSSENNVKNMIWRIECLKHDIPYACPWTEITDEIIDLIVNDKTQSLKKITRIRELLGLLFISNIEANILLEYILKCFIKLITNEKLLSSIVNEIAIYDKQLKNSTRYMLHFEALFNSIIFILENPPL